MITPAFKCTQNENFVIVTISLPNVKMSSMEYSTVDNTFRFYVKPYFLRLTFAEHEHFSNDGSDFAKYDADQSLLYVHLPKKDKDVHWDDLDMVTRLLSSNTDLPSFPTEQQQTIQPKNETKSFSFDSETSSPQLQAFPADKQQKRPLIEVISEHNFEDNENVEMSEQQVHKPDFNFSWEQTYRPLPEQSNRQRDNSLLQIEEEELEEPTVQITAETKKYGFDQQYSDFFTNYTRDLISEVIDLYEPEATDLAQRTMQRKEDEQEAFDVEHYLADYVNDETIEELLLFKPRFASGKKKEILWNEVEQTMLQNLPKKRYLLNDERAVYLSLIDILCAYCYNHRTFFGENTVESGWTISKLTSTLSWFDKFDSLFECLKSFIGRSLCYPLYRHWKLSTQCIRDVITLFTSGKSQILRCLLEIKYIFEHSPGSGQYLLNKLYIDDYCSWIQFENENRFIVLAQEMEQTLNRITIAEFEQEFKLGTIMQFAHDNMDEMKREAEQLIDHSKPQELL
jgi:protein SHQ1